MCQGRVAEPQGHRKVEGLVRSVGPKRTASGELAALDIGGPLGDPIVPLRAFTVLTPRGDELVWGDECEAPTKEYPPGWEDIVVSISKASM